MTPEARVSVPTGIPGTPGMPAPTASSVPGSVVKPAPDNADIWLTAGVDQLAGTDIGPIDLAPVSTADTAPPPLVNAVGIAGNLVRLGGITAANICDSDSVVFATIAFASMVLWPAKLAMLRVAGS